MAKVIVNRENFKVDEIELNKGTLNIGRHQDNDLCLDDLAVSGHHAKIVTVFDSSYVEDLKSTNGTFVNGKPIKTHTLHNGDVLTIGHYQLLFQGVHPSASDANATMMIDASQAESLMAEAQLKQQGSEVKLGINADPFAATKLVKEVQQPAVAKKPVLVSQQPAEAVAPPQDVALPEIDSSNPLAEQRSQAPREMKKFRKSDANLGVQLRIIVLAILAAAATFSVLYLLLK